MSEIIFMFWVVLIFWFVVEIINDRLNRNKKVIDVFSEFDNKQ
ncbi:MAG TPA: hypothetical protein PK358_03805 [Spirochaetota bacterium]|nr:hypothetical protein [Spirochaetota bacterium]HPJ33932.1 hypothetical protein [Spirochaetota bacterium]